MSSVGLAQLLRLLPELVDGIFCETSHAFANVRRIEAQGVANVLERKYSFIVTGEDPLLCLLKHSPRSSVSGFGVFA